MGLTAFVAVLMAIAFLPGAFAQQGAIEQGAVTGVREQAGTVTGGATGALAGLNTALLGIAPPAVLAVISGALNAVLAAIVGVLNFIGTIIGGIWSLCTPIWAVCVSTVGTLASMCLSVVLGLCDYSVLNSLLAFCGNLGLGSANSIVDFVQMCSYWIGDIYLGMKS